MILYTYTMQKCVYIGSHEKKPSGEILILITGTPQTYIVQPWADHRPLRNLAPLLWQKMRQVPCDWSIETSQKNGTPNKS